MQLPEPATGNSFRELSTPPSYAFLSSLPFVPVYCAFQKLQEWNQLEQGRRMVKRRRNRWVGTGTGFCFPAREGASPIGSSHAHTHGYGRKAWCRLGRRKNEETRNDMLETSQPVHRLGKTGMILGCAKKISSQEIQCHPSSSESSRLKRHNNLKAIT